jgi:hypothetical protein
MAVTILLIVNLLIPNAASAQTLASPRQERSLNGATDLSIQSATPARTLYVTNGGGNVAAFVISPVGVPAPLDVVTNVGTILRGIAIAPDGRSAIEQGGHE